MPKKKKDDEKVNDVFAYAPTASRSGMMRSDKRTDGEKIEEDDAESTVRELIRKEIRDLLQK